MVHLIFPIQAAIYIIFRQAASSKRPAVCWNAQYPWAPLYTI